MENEQLYRFFARETDAAEDAEVRRWVESSDDNKNRFFEERKLYDLASIMSADRQAEPVAELRRPGWRPILYKVAAAVLVAVLSIGIYRTAMPDDAAQSLVAMQAIEVPAGQRLHVRLTDGSEVWLNSHTRLEFPTDFNAECRVVRIDGEGYFEVSKDAAHPFIVEAPSLSVRVTGTTFNIDNYSECQLASVSLVEGSVDVDVAGRTTRLQPGQKLFAEGSSTRVNQLDNTEIDWIDGIISFRQLPLTDIMKRFEKYYGYEIEYSRAGKINASRYSGRFYMADGIEQALSTLQRDAAFSYEIDRESRTVCIKN